MELNVASLARSVYMPFALQRPCSVCLQNVLQSLASPTAVKVICVYFQLLHPAVAICSVAG